MQYSRGHVHANAEREECRQMQRRPDGHAHKDAVRDTCTQMQRKRDGQAHKYSDRERQTGTYIDTERQRTTHRQRGRERHTCAHRCRETQGMGETPVHTYEESLCPLFTANGAPCEERLSESTDWMAASPTELKSC
uniref:Uncharacterized protein n=1 Tax=Calidris pygmaea TaxID=425635 RepID=A0A8C3JJA4_9CHAR